MPDRFDIEPLPEGTSYTDIWTGPDSPFETISMREALAKANAEFESKMAALAAWYGMTPEEFRAHVEKIHANGRQTA